VSGPTEQKKQRRLILISMMLDLNSLVRDAGIPFDEAMVEFAIRLGQLNGRAMDNSSIAAITRIPQPSVSRYIVALRKRGRVRSVKVGRRTLQYIPLTPAEPPTTSRFYNEVEKIFWRACRSLPEQRVE
jgi:hypothetical protein